MWGSPEPPDEQVEHDLGAGDRGIGQPAAVPAVDPRRDRAAARARPGLRAGAGEQPQPVSGLLDAFDDDAGQVRQEDCEVRRALRTWCSDMHGVAREQRRVFQDSRGQPDHKIVDRTRFVPVPSCSCTSNTTGQPGATKGGVERLSWAGGLRGVHCWRWWSQRWGSASSVARFQPARSAAAA